MSRGTAIAIAIAVLACGAPGGIATAATSRSAAGACANDGIVAMDDAARVQAVEAVRCLINLERANRGLRALRASAPLQNAATGHSADMVASKFLSHTSANGDSFRRRILRNGYVRRTRGWSVGETLTWGSGGFATPAQLVTALMQSPEHRRTILDRRFLDMGVGMVLGAPMDGMTGGRAATVTVDFGHR
jgi:uncharacterized protein YkwD